MSTTSDVVNIFVGRGKAPEDSVQKTAYKFLIIIQRAMRFSRRLLPLKFNHVGNSSKLSFFRHNAVSTSGHFLILKSKTETWNVFLGFLGPIGVGAEIKRKSPSQLHADNKNRPVAFFHFDEPLESRKLWDFSTPFLHWINSAPGSTCFMPGYFYGKNAS